MSKSSPTNESGAQPTDKAGGALLSDGQEEQLGRDDPTPVAAPPPGKGIADGPTEVAEVTADGVVTTPIPAEPDTERFAGRVLANRYKITRRLGTGGFGAVFAAEDTKIRKQVAVKVLTRDLVTDSAILTRFRKEAEAASKVGHENIVDITDFDRTVDGHYFMVMEYLEGIDLGKVIRSDEQVSIARILGIMIQVCRALDASHGGGVVHRDLKPGNIFLTARGSRADFVKVLDFGISKIMEVDDESARLTRTGQIIGTPLYMAPEQACGEENVDHRADIYSVGVIMYELVTGKPPFTAVNYLGIIAQHASDPPVPPSKQRPDLEIPPLLETIILKAMAKQPEDRFSTMSEMEGGLIEALATVDPTSAVGYSPTGTPASLMTPFHQLRPRDPMPWWLRRRGVRIGGMVGIVALLGVGIAVYSGWFDRKTEIPPVPRAAAVVVPDARATKVEQRRDTGPPAPASTIVKIRVTSRPRGAEVFDVSGKSLGKTPLTLAIPQSKDTMVWTLKKKGYRVAKVELVPDSDQTLPGVQLKRHRVRGLPDDPKGWGQR